MSAYLLPFDNNLLYVIRKLFEAFDLKCGLLIMSFYQKHSKKLYIIAAAAGVLIAKYLITKFRRNNENKCIIVQSVEDWDANEKGILAVFNKSRIIGIDCEWVTDGTNRKPVSLLQLANNNGFCVLIRLPCIPVWRIPPGLSELLKDRNILKVGVGVNDDASKLFNDYGLDVLGLIDLRHLVQDMRELQGKPLGLKSLAKELLGYELDKSFTLRCGDWDAETLTPNQIKYAADDAIVSAKLFENIRYRKASWLSFKSYFDGDVELYMDMPFKQTSSNNNVTKTAGQPAVKFKSRYSKPRSKPMYDNCQLIAPDGEVLCSCDRKKAEWYVYKGLGEAVCEEPFTVRLNFEPSGRPKLDNIFYTMEKENCCVVCGQTQNYHRKFVVPTEYRRYFPDLMKKNLSHDVLLLCVGCHKRSNILDQKMRVKLSELCDAPLIAGRYAKFKFNGAAAHVRSAASALSLSGDKIPEERKKELRQKIADYFDVSEVDDKILQEALNLEATVLNESFVPHGLKVYEYFCKNGGLMHFEKMWRQYFLDTMQPKFLPEMWSVEHNHKRLALQVINHERDVNFDASILGIDPDLIKDLEKSENEST